MFFETYTEKVWGIPCTEIGADWAAQRIKGMNLGEAVRNALFGQGKSSRLTTLIDEFHYPRLGPGQLWEDCAKSVQRAGWEIRLGTRLIGTRVDNGRVVGVAVSESGGTPETLPCTEFISSVPLRELIAGIHPAPADAVTSAAGRLAYRDFVTVALILDAESVFPDNWIYIHAPEVKLGRIQNFKNWSPDMVPDPARTCLGLEYFCNEGDSLWCSTDDELVQLGYEEIRRIRITDRPLLGGYVVRMPKAYPVYDTGYRERLDCLREYLASIRGLHCVGRNGQHRYNNMDHSMVTALLAARNIAQGQTNDPWAVNEDAEYHEVAGPQDPLKA
jgi:protoporphyrinogen oxidase